MKLPLNIIFRALVPHWDSLDTIQKLFTGFAYMVQELNEVFVITINDPALMKTIDLPFLDKADLTSEP